MKDIGIWAAAARRETDGAASEVKEAVGKPDRAIGLMILSSGGAPIKVDREESTGGRSGAGIRNVIS
jgi:hypothetical protein